MLEFHYFNVWEGERAKKQRGNHRVTQMPVILPHGLRARAWVGMLLPSGPIAE